MTADLNAALDDALGVEAPAPRQGRPGPPPVAATGLVRVADGGAPIEVELWGITPAALGSFLLDVPRPLAIGSVELADGSWWKGFICEAVALDGAIDITHAGGWRRHLAATVG